MTDHANDRKKDPRELMQSQRANAACESDASKNEKSVKVNDALCWPFPAGSQNDTDKAVTLKPYVPPKRRTLN